MLAYMRRCEGNDRAALDEPLDSRVRRNPVEDQGQDAALQFFQLPFRAFQQAYAAGAFGPHAVVIMLELWPVQFPAESFEIGEPLEFGRMNRQPSGEIAGCFDDGKVPLPGRG